jgi:hypothetical protein
MSNSCNQQSIVRQRFEDLPELSPKLKNSRVPVAFCSAMVHPGGTPVGVPTEPLNPTHASATALCTQAGLSSKKTFLKKKVSSLGFSRIIESAPNTPKNGKYI